MIAIKQRYISMVTARATALLTAAAILLMPPAVLAQGTSIDAPDNKYSLAQDVQLGRQSAAEVERQLPLLREGRDVDNYVERVGRMDGVTRTTAGSSPASNTRPPVTGLIGKAISIASTCRITGASSKITTR